MSDPRPQALHVEWVPIDSVKPYARNPRKNDAGVDAVAASIRDFGWRQPIVVDADRVIVVGHTRWKAARKLGLASVPIHIADLTPEQARAYRIADNQSNTFSEWDQPLLTAELKELRGLSFDLATLGFTSDALQAWLSSELPGSATDPDQIPAPPDQPTTRRGDIWVLGAHRLHCGDSADPTDLDRLLDGAAVHLVNTDPPYNVKVKPRSNNAIAAGNFSFPAQQTHHQSLDLARHPGKSKPTDKKLRAKDRPLINDFVTDAAFDKLLAGWFSNIARVLKPGRGFYIWGGYTNCANYPPALAAAKLYFSQAIIWVKEHPALTHKDFMGNHEWCFYGWREGGPHVFLGTRNIPDVWELKRLPPGSPAAIGRGVRITSPTGMIDVTPAATKRPLRQIPMPADGLLLSDDSPTADVWRVRKVTPQQMVHLTEKPVELAIRAMQLSSREGETVLDLFGGSGSTLIGCEMTQRRACLMELDPAYCDVIVSRWETFTGRKAERLQAP